MLCQFRVKISHGDDDEGVGSEQEQATSVATSNRRMPARHMHAVNFKGECSCLFA